MIERWAVIKEYPSYEVSDNGSIRRTYKNGKKKVLVPWTNGHGYPSVHLCEKQKKYFHTVHKLVCRYFVSGYTEELVVNHKDGNKNNAHYKNLEWVTHSENNKHAFLIGLRSNAGERSPRHIHKCRHGAMKYKLTKRRDGNTI